MLIFLFILTLTFGGWRVVTMLDYLAGVPSSNDDWLYF